MLDPLLAIMVTLITYSLYTVCNKLAIYATLKRVVIGRRNDYEKKQAEETVKFLMRSLFLCSLLYLYYLIFTN